MGRWLLWKGATLLMTLWVIATLTFVLMCYSPGSPFDEDQALPAAIKEGLMRHYGLDKPWYIQYSRYLSNAIHGDLGVSFAEKGRSINQIIWEGFPISALLGLEALLIAIPLGIGLGTLCASQPHSRLDWLLLGCFSLGSSFPTFATAICLQLVFGLWLAWLPIARWGTPLHTLLPALSLALGPMLFIARLIREQLISISNQPYLITARAKGLSSWRILLHHKLRNVSVPFFVYLGPLLANLLTGSFVVEKIFAIPGLGHWFVQSIGNRDYPAIMGITLFYSVLLLASVTVSELIAAWIDPRLRSEARRNS